ncbi:MAG: CPBP family intramembrane metalloprotease [Treponemataceae bacterium]|nr:CPBP family intramembrane metalloprotease [Treponemataceae bacterium]
MEIEKIMPVGISETIYTVLCFSISALYEELLYRQFLPDESLSMIPSKHLRLPVEILIVLLFALGHIYLGIWAVMNAFVAGCLLRFFCVKTASFLSGFIAHFIYNLIVFFFM